jgi:hypothetical protein
MYSRILVDVSAQCRPSAQALNACLRIEREIARRLVDDASLNALPIVFQSGSMYAIDREQAADLLRREVPTEALPDIRPPAVEPIPAERLAEGRPEREEPALPTTAPNSTVVAQGLSEARYSFRRLALRMALRCVTLGARGVISLAPERARVDLKQSLLYARNAGVAIVRPPQPRQDAAFLASPPEEQVEPELGTGPADEPAQPEPGASPPERAPSECPRLSTMVYPTRHDVVWISSAAAQPVPLRRLAEAKLTTGFRLASICFEMDTVRTIDQLDASDLIFCVATDVQAKLDRFATECGRPTPRCRLLPSHAEWEMSAALVKSELVSLMDSASV